jgi:hypothetical protein
MSDVGEKLHLGAQEGADAGDVDSALMWRPHNTEVREPSMVTATLLWIPILLRSDLDFL